MGKRKRSSGTERPNAKWNLEDVWKLLGMLDFCIKHAHVFPFNEAIIVGPLRSASELDDGFTWNQIKGKLDMLWRTYGEDTPEDKGVKRTKAEIYSKGSRCLTGFTDSDIASIAANLESLENILKPAPPKTRRSKSFIPSKKINAGVECHTPKRDMISGERLTPRAQRLQLREFTSHLNWKKESSESTLRAADVTPQIIQETDEHSQSLNNNSVGEEFESLILPSRHHTKDQASLDELEFRSLDKIRTPTSSILTWPDSEDDMSFTPERIEDEVQPPHEHSNPSLDDIERTHKAQLRKKDERITELQETIITKGKLVDKLETRLSSFQTVQSTQADGSESVHDYIANLNQEIKDLKEAKDYCRKMGSFTKMTGNYDDAGDMLDLATAIASIRYQMKSILGGYDILLQAPESSISKELHDLLSFGFDFMLGDATPPTPPYTTIPGFIDAAIFVWVFESRFPDLAQKPTGLSLLTTYRDIIVLQDGPVALRNLEHATHCTLIKTPMFDNILKQEAENLATLLSKTLAPFFPRNANESENNCFETWGEDTEVWKLRQQRLVAIFKDALRFKAKSYLTSKRYEIVSCLPGTPFNPTTMSAETVGGAPDHISVERRYVVDYCVHVAIQAFTRDALNEMDPVSEAVIQPVNFTRRGSKDYSKAMGATLLVKAVVVLKMEKNEHASK